MICLTCGVECQTAHHWDGAKSYKEWICGDCKVKELTNRLAKAEKERDELKRGKSCAGCKYIKGYGWCMECSRQEGLADFWEPRDPSAGQGGGRGMRMEDQALSLSNRSLRSALAQCRADLAAAHKWAIAWKHKNGYDRMMHGIYRVSIEKLRSDLSAAHAELDALKKWQLDVADGIGFVNRARGVAGHELADAETIVTFWKERDEERDYCVESARRFSWAYKRASKKYRAEIERLNGRRCDTCKHGTPYYGPDQMKVKSAIWCTVNSGMDERVSKRFEFGEHYCKSWEKR